MIQSIFVYGTLKQGHLRAGVWPHAPIVIHPAIIRATLYDLGPYPAIGPGDTWVLGEVWNFQAEYIPKTLEILDAVEGYAALGKDNEYQRIEISAMLIDHSHIAAFTYQFADLKRLQRYRRISPWSYFGDTPCSSWPDQDSIVPTCVADEPNLMH